MGWTPSHLNGIEVLDWKRYKGAHHRRLLSKLNDGEQVEPAPAEPDNDHVRQARQSDWELARE